MNKHRYVSVISTLAGLLVITSVSAQDVLKTDTQDFEARNGFTFGLCGNLQVLCGWASAEGDSKADFNEVKIDGKITVENVLKKIIKKNPRYQWVIEDGVINITPKKEYRHLVNGKDPLDTIVEDFTLKDETTREVSYEVCDAAGLNCIPREYAGFRQLCNKISLKLSRVTLRAALNKIIKADGMASWELGYSGKDKHPTIDINCWRPGSILFEDEPISSGGKPETLRQPIENKSSEVEQPITSPYWYKLLLFALSLLVLYFIVRTFRAKIKPRDR